jgi:hypothetical protein
MKKSIFGKGQTFMGKTGTHVLKKGNVELQGQFRLDIIPIKQGSPKSKGAELAAPQSRIVENCPEFAIIEITCSCGSKLRLKCEYANNSKPSGDQVK